MRSDPQFPTHHQLTPKAISKAASRVCTSGTWTTGSQAVCCSRSVRCYPFVDAATVLTGTAVNGGSWDSIHVFDAQDRARTAHYKLTSTVILSLGTESDALGNLDLSGNMVRQVEQDMAVVDDGSHVANIGKMVEDMELKMRNLLQEVYFGKAKDVVGDLRSMLSQTRNADVVTLTANSGLPSLSQTNRDRQTQREMINSMNR